MINLSEVSIERKFVFMALMNAALKVKDMGYDEEYFMQLVKGAWETVQMNDPDDLFNILQKSMAKELSIMFDEPHEF